LADDRKGQPTRIDPERLADDRKEKPTRIDPERLADERKAIGWPAGMLRLNNG
jgi:hypothetical protein